MSIPSLSGDFVVYLNDKNPDIQQLRSTVGEDNFSSFRALAVCWASLLGDSPIGLKPHRTVRRFLTEVLNDPLGTLKTFGALANKILEDLSVDDKGDISVTFLGEMRDTPIFKEYHAFVKTHDPALLRYIITFLEFGKRVPYSHPDLDLVSFRNWDLVENRISEVCYDGIADNIRPILLYLLQAWSATEFLPGHGPGSVANQGVRSLQEKNESFSVSPTISRLYFDSWLSAERGSLYPSPDGSLPPIDHDHTPARLIFVPKSWKTSRSICMEPVGTQWAQQGVRRWLESAIAEGPLVNHVVLSDQGVNRAAALWASKTQGCSTLDLSSASDSVAWALVKRVFPPKVLKHLAATRTRDVTLPDGSTRRVHKFAPMGSAVCFPVQSLLYSSIIAMVEICDAYGLDWRVPGSVLTIGDLDVAWHHCYDVRHPYDYTSRYFPFKVFGDDILATNESVSNIVEALRVLGFEVNEDKSFVRGDAYRESCGMHAFRGFDVTPFRFKVETLSTRLSAASFASLVDLANRARWYGYDTCRKHIVQMILYSDIEGLPRAKGRNPVLFVEGGDTTTSLAIRTDDVRNHHLQLRNPKVGRDAGPWDTLQCKHAECVRITPVYDGQLSRQFDNYRHVRWWASVQPSEESYSVFGAAFNPHDVKLGSARQALAAGAGLELGWTPVQN